MSYNREQFDLKNKMKGIKAWFDLRIKKQPVKEDVNCRVKNMVACYKTGKWLAFK
jgi:hypothetical protein